MIIGICLIVLFLWLLPKNYVIEVRKEKEADLIDAYTKRLRQSRRSGTA